MVFLMESVATTTLLSAFVYLEGNLLVGVAIEGQLSNVRGINGTFEEDADCHFRDSLHACGRILLNFVDSDIVLAVSCGSNCCHFVV